MFSIFIFSRRHIARVRLKEKHAYDVLFRQAAKFIARPFCFDRHCFARTHEYNNIRIIRAQAVHVTRPISEVCCVCRMENEVEWFPRDLRAFKHDLDDRDCSREKRAACEWYVNRQNLFRGAPETSGGTYLLWLTRRRPEYTYRIKGIARRDSPVLDAHTRMSAWLVESVMLMRREKLVTVGTQRQIFPYRRPNS